MLPNALTPPSESTAEAIEIDTDNGTTALVSGPYNYSAEQFPTPMSSAGIGLESTDGCESIEDRSDTQDMSDDDQDMSYGGAALTMTLSHAEQLNAELDQLDADIMGPENLVGLFLETHYPAMMQSQFHYSDSYTSPTHYSDESLDQPEEGADVYMQGLADATIHNLPTSLSAVSLQLQHIQEGQEHAESADAADELHSALINNMDDQNNLNLGEFLYNWGVSSGLGEEPRRRPRGPALTALYQQRLLKLEPVERKDLQGDRCDIQRINWEELGVSRLEARQMRRSTYKNYTNLRFTRQWHPRLDGARLSDDQNFFRFNRMDFDQDVHLAHFQLRNLMTCASRDHIFYAGKSRILQWNPSGGSLPKIAMDLTDPVVQPFHSYQPGIQISTLTAAHDILVAGGFCGEYALVNLKAQKDTKHTEGLITDHVNSITNHVQVYQSRHSSLPLASFASNDMIVRILDIATNKFIAEHSYDHAINCTAVSPDQRLRVLVGDTRSVMICNADTGEVLQNLEGHRDFGFACDWADDGWTVATGNQDMQIKIWDARKWTGSNGIAYPIHTVAAEMAGVRKLKFSPLGSGKRILLAAEPADIISVIEAENFNGKQTLSFFGEIGGLDFTNDGQTLYVANCDNMRGGMRGGIMEFERCDWASSDLHYFEQYEDMKIQQRRRRRLEGYDWAATEDDVVNHRKSRGTREQRRRKAADLGVTMGHF